MITQRTYPTSAALQRGLFLLVLLVGLLMSFQSYAAEVAQKGAGKVIFVFGQAWKHGIDGGKYDIKRGMVVKVGEVIETSATGQVQIRMSDNGLISIRPSSQFKIKAFKFSGANGANSSDDKSYFQLFKGGFRSITGAVGEANKKHYKVITPVATIGIRGTDYSARLCEGDCARGDGLYVGVWRGGISLSNNAGVLNVDAGQFGYVPDSTTAGQPLDNLPAGMLVASTGVSADTATGQKPSTTIAELAAGESSSLIEPDLLSQPSLALPSHGTASYNLSNISATSGTGATLGTGSTASLSADFGAMTASASLTLNMSDSSSWSGTASGMSIQQNNASFSGPMSGVSSMDASRGGSSTSASGNIVNGSLTGLSNNGTAPPTDANLSFNMNATYFGGSNSVSGTASGALSSSTP